MADQDLIASVRANDLASVSSLLGEGVDIERRDEHGWTALCWAAGGGNLAIAELLLARGADAFGTGQDLRTPYKIALAAGHIDVARLLRQAEERVGGEALTTSSGQSATRPYCRAYPLKALRQYGCWREAATDGEPLVDDTIVFVHRDFSVTRSMWPRDDVVFEGTLPDWQRFCVERLAFQPPDDFEWVPAASAR
jgi:hypothetical protein